MRRPLFLIALAGFTLLAAIPAFAEADPPGKKAATEQVEENDADVPPFARDLIDKEEYLKARDGFVGELRGLPYDALHNPRVRAIRQMETQERMQRLLSPDIVAGTWEAVGPAPLPNGQTEGAVTAVSGRTISIAVHPTDPNIVYVGTAQGGIYRSTDGGLTWKAIFDSALSLAVGALAISPSSPSTLFVGTGEPNSSCDSFFGVGVYRITNADTTPVLAGPFNLDGVGVDVMSGRSVGKIAVHPADPNVIFVGTANGIGGIACAPSVNQPNRGLYRSTNAMGVAPTFKKLNVATANGGNRSVTDVVLEPGNPNVALCSVVGFSGPGDGGVYRSTNALAADPVFTRPLEIGTAGGTIRSELTINKVGSTVTAFVAAGETAGACGGQGTLRRSTDGGATWGPPLASADGFCGGQCFYDIAVAVDPNNAQNVLLGGNVTGACSRLIARSTTGGTSFTNVATGVHADNHVVTFAPSNPSIVYMGTDGGVYKSTNGGVAWTSMNNEGFNATQFQSLALHPLDREFMIGGTQDNGTPFKRADGTWTRADYGDGGFSLIDQGAADTNNVTMYHTYFNFSGFLMGFGRVNTAACATEANWAFRGTGIAPDATPVCDGSANTTENGINLFDAVLFYAPIALGPGTPNTVYFGSDRLYRSTNKGDTMVLVSQGPIASGARVSAIGISPQNDNVRIVGLTSGGVYRTTTGSSTLTDVTGPIPARYIGRAVIDPTNVNTAYVTLSGFGVTAGQHVWKTTNLNAGTPTWVAAGSGIPDVPVNAFVVDPQNANALYAGTDIGVYRSTNGGTSWTPYSNDLPRVAVFDMGIQSPNRVLRIATHGRGIWEISISPFALAEFSESFPANGGTGSVPVTGPSGPGWTAVSNDPWITITDAGPGTGNGTVDYTVAAHGSAARRIGSITVANQTFTVLQGAAFPDVPVSHPFYTFIGKLSARGVTGGCGGGNYCPASTVTREQMAAFIIRALGEFNPAQPASQRYLDVPLSSSFSPFIEQMALRQIAAGCGGNNYCPANPVNRQQMAAFIIKGLGELDPPTPPLQRFNDVPSGNPFYDFIDRMSVLNITGGCSVTPPLYCPLNPVNRGQMAVFLVKAFGL